MSAPQPDPAVGGALPYALYEKLAFLAAHAMRYQAIRDTSGEPDKWWSLLGEMGQEARDATELISKVLPSRLEEQARLKADAYSARNTIASVRDELITKLADGRNAPRVRIQGGKEAAK